MSVAPKRCAASSRFVWMSMTMIFDAPAMRAPLTALRPTPPAPKITIVSPALTFAVFKSERTHDVISDTDLRYVGADCGNDPGDLVAKHGRRRNEIVSGKEQVSVTQPGRLYVDENFVANGRGDVYILEVEPTTDSVEYKRLHMRPPASLQSPRTDLVSENGPQSHGLTLCRFEVGRFPKSVALGRLLRPFMFVGLP